MPRHNDKLWAITSYFNPLSYDRRLQNYRHFRNALTVPLLVVELSNSQQYELRSDEADIIIRTASKSVLWQKERLLNVALRNLPPHVEYVAWLDCDVIFERQDWHVAAIHELRNHSLIQLFSARSDLPRECSHPGSSSTGMGWTIDSVAKHVSMISQNASGPVCGEAKSILKGAFGLAWAARRELLERHGLYDAMIMGSGDVALVCAAFGNIPASVEAIRLNSAQYRHYESWAAGFHCDVGENVGYVEGKVFHLWHGERLHRQYARRHVEFAKMEFDPNMDLQVNETGAFEWADGRDDLNRFATEYFRCRFEDGA